MPCVQSEISEIFESIESALIGSWYVTWKYPLFLKMGDWLSVVVTQMMNVRACDYRAVNYYV